MQTFGRKYTVAIIILAIFTLLTTVGLQHTYAQEPVPQLPPEVYVNENAEVRPDLGPQHQDPNLVPGENGYKVFHPGAIVSLEVLVSEQTTGPEKVVTRDVYVRRGNTDLYARGGLFGGMTADHSSSSDLREDRIRVEGQIRMMGGPVDDTCIDEDNNVHAVHDCNTNIDGPEGDYEAKGYHEFEESGYKDTTLRTKDEEHYSG